MTRSGGWAEQGRSAGRDLRDAGGGRRARGVRRVRRRCTEATGGTDGLVSLEVSPTLADDTEATIHEAERLWAAVDRPNAMIKIPGTEAGLPAITHCVAAGISVNVTLLFSVERYGKVIEAWLEGMERRLRARPSARAGGLGRELLRESGGRQGGSGAGPAGRVGRYPRLPAAWPDRDRQRLRGLPAVRVVAGHPAVGPPGQGRAPGHSGRCGRPPAPRIPRYPDIYYVEALVAPRTVNTLPPETFAAYRDHGRPAVRIQEGIAAAQGELKSLGDLGIDIATVTRELEEDGVAKFAASYRSLLAGIEAKAGELVGSRR